MALNLSRNTRVWFTTNVDPSNGVLKDATTGYTAFTAANTFEIQVLDGYSFGQATNAADITVSEAGNTPARGKRSFNTALNPADFSFSTYIRPQKSTASTVTAIEKCLWNALTSASNLDATGVAAVTATTITRASTTAAAFTGLQATFSPAPVAGEVYNLVGSSQDGFNQPFSVTSVVGSGPYTVAGTFMKAPPVASGLTATTSATTKVHSGSWAENGTATTSYAYASVAGSNKNQLQKFAMIFLVDNVYYAIDNCALNQATIDFGLDAISMIAWTGNGTAVKQLTSFTTAAQATAITSTSYATSAAYITNKLSTVTLEANIGGGGTSYIVPITGGSITINNNNNYITPSNLGTVNIPIGYYTGGRNISGSLNAYLRTGTATETGGLLTALLAAGAETKYRLQIEIGGASNSTRVELDMQGVALQVPTIDVQDVVSTTINFSAQGTDPLVANASYDITATNDLSIKYFSAVTA